MQKKGVLGACPETGFYREGMPDAECGHESANSLATALGSAMSVGAVVRSMRFPFLILSPVCVFLGASTAQINRDNLGLLALALLGALLAHAGVNMLNEYLDFRSGLDLMTRRTPFSGGSGALPDMPEAAPAVRFSGGISLSAVVAIGLFLAWKCGATILPIGLAGLALIVLYTDRINRHPWLCLIAPGSGFGLLMVAGTHCVLSGGTALYPWIVGAIPFFLINNLLLLNQYPDIQADARAQRRHLPIVAGIAASNFLYAVFALMAVIAIATGAWSGYFPALSLIALLPMPLAFVAWRGAVVHRENIGNHPGYLAANVAVAILAPLLLGISLVLG